MIIRQQVYDVDNIGRWKYPFSRFPTRLFSGSDYLYWLVQGMFTNILLSHSLLFVVYSDIIIVGIYAFIVINHLPPPPCHWRFLYRTLGWILHTVRVSISLILIPTYRFVIVITFDPHHNNWNLVNNLTKANRPLEILIPMD